MKTPIYNLKGEKKGEVELNPKIFGVEFKPDLINQAILAIRANKRALGAHVRTRAEVRGGGKKPWRQKGTGRARHGSIRSPIWTGGGITFGPSREKDYSKKINRKAKRLALFSALSKKLSDDELKIVDELKISGGKTKEMFEIIRNLYGESLKKKRKVDLLLVLARVNSDVLKAARNLVKVKLTLANSLNVEDLMVYKNVLMEERSLKVIEETYLK